MEDEIKNGWGVAALVFAIFSIMFIILPFLGILFSLLAILFSLFAKNRLSRAGRIVGITSLILNTVALFLFAAAVGSVVTTISKANSQLGAFQDRFNRYDEIADKSEKLMTDKPCPGVCVSRPDDCLGDMSLAECPGDRPICCT